MTQDRAQIAYDIRVEAADLARHRKQPKHEANPDEQRYSAARYPMSFTKGLDHDPDTGVVKNPAHFEAFRAAIDEGHIETFTTRVQVPQPPKGGSRRKWEAPTAGIVYDLEGPDAQAVTMPPAPELGSDELTYEMAEVYELALLRDVPITSFDVSGGAQDGDIDDAVDRLNKLPYAQAGYPGRPRKTEADIVDGGSDKDVVRQTAFRGSSPGVEAGPYISQFLWIGGRDQTGTTDLKDGCIPYGAQLIDQRVPAADTHDDYMKTWDEWLIVQQGFDPRNCGPGQKFTATKKNDGRRFICSPRDLATYVHFDALYQAYLNATLILLGMNTPFDPGFAKLSGMRDLYNPAGQSTIKQNAGGFALYGGPHILTLVTEVATRALKAVRYQKFNNHLRLRPEALAGRISRAHELENKYPVLCHAFTDMKDDLEHTLKAIDKKNGKDKKLPKGNFLLPMAFQEGSPMHPTYGAGHATVAGACTTIVKAYFDTGTILGVNGEGSCEHGKVGFYRNISSAVCFEAKSTGKDAGKVLDHKVLGEKDCPLTLEGELNKLAANISIGRNMAGVHYFSDYYDSLRMGEEIAIGMLQEQALCYPTDDFVLSVPTFDGSVVRIGRK